MLPGVRAAGFDTQDDVLFVQLHMADSPAEPETDVGDAHRGAARRRPFGRGRDRALAHVTVAAGTEPADVDRRRRLVDLSSESAARPRLRRTRDASRPAPTPRTARPAALARGARVPRHRRARGPPDPRRPPHDRPRARVARARRRGRSHHRRDPRARRADRAARRSGHASLDSNGDERELVAVARRRRCGRSRRSTTAWRPARVRSTPRRAPRSTRCNRRLARVL